jgi:hypothetical protein
LLDWVAGTARLQAAPAAGAQLRLLAELQQDIAVISGRVKELEQRLGVLVKAWSTLTLETGIGVVAAAALLAEVGDPARFRSESAFNRWWGGAPVAVSSGKANGEPVRHRLDLLGNRAVNCVMHMMSVTQGRCHQPAQAYLARNGVRDTAAGMPAEPTRLNSADESIGAGGQIDVEPWPAQPTAAPTPSKPQLDKGASATPPRCAPRCQRPPGCRHMIALSQQNRSLGRDPGQFVRLTVRIMHQFKRNSSSRKRMG